MRPKSLVLLLLALGCGLVAAIGVAQLLGTKNKNAPSADPDMTNVVVAVEDFSVGSIVTEEMVTVEQWPKDMVREGMITTLEGAMERRSKASILEGMPLMEKHLSLKGELASAGAAQLIPKGFRSVPVRVDVVSGGGSMIMPGDRVDVVVMVREGRDFNASVTKTIVQDVKVFAVDDLFTLEGTEGQKSINAQTISLLLMPDQTEKIMMASEMGRIRLSLRNPEDTEVADLRGVEPEMLLSGTVANNRETENTIDQDQIRALIERELAMRSNTEGFHETPPPNQFTMRVISGGEVSEIVLELEEEFDSEATVAEHESDDADTDSQFSMWRLLPSYGKGNHSDTTEPVDEMAVTIPAGVETEDATPDAPDADADADETSSSSSDGPALPDAVDLGGFDLGLDSDYDDSWSRE